MITKLLTAAAIVFSGFCVGTAQPVPNYCGEVKTQLTRAETGSKP